MNWDWDITNLRVDEEVTTPLFTIETVERFKELPAGWGIKWDKENLWPYRIRIREKIKDGANSYSELSVFKNTFKNTTETEKDFDVFWFFVHHLNKKVEIPFENFFQDEENNTYFCLSDSSDFSDDNKNINKIITDEKEKWVKLDYTEKNSDNKRWVDAGVYQKYQQAFHGTGIADNLTEVKKWQDNENETKLNSSEAVIASENGWLTSEVKEKKGSLDGKNYLYDVLKLNKNGIHVESCNVSEHNNLKKQLKIVQEEKEELEARIVLWTRLVESMNEMKIKKDDLSLKYGDSSEILPIILDKNNITRDDLFTTKVGENILWTLSYSMALRKAFEKAKANNNSKLIPHMRIHTINQIVEPLEKYSKLLKSVLSVSEENPTHPLYLELEITEMQVFLSEVQKAINFWNNKIAEKSPQAKVEVPPKK